MLQIGPITILRTAHYQDLYAQAATVNVDLLAACRAADAYLHNRYPRLDEEQAALCDQLVTAVAAAYADRR